MPKKPCASCKTSAKRSTDWFVHCSKCRLSWHTRCLYEPIPIDENKRRSKNSMSHIVESSWGDWQCRACRGRGHEGIEFRPPEQNNGQVHTYPRPRTSTPAKRTTAPERVDLTLDPDSGDEIVILDKPPRATRPAPRPLRPPPASKREVISILSSPELSPRPLPARNPASATNDLNNALPRTPTPELQPLQTPELHHPSEQPTDNPRRSRSTIPDLSMMDLGTLAAKDYSLEFRLPVPTQYERRLRCSDPTFRSPTQPQPTALRASQHSILTTHVLKTSPQNQAVQSIGLKELRCNGWSLEDREEARALPAPPRSTSKGKQRAVGERTRDWTPLVVRETAAQIAEQEFTESQKQSVTRLVPPPPPPMHNPPWISKPHPPRQPRKRVAKPRDPEIKIEDQDLALVLS